MRSLHPSPHSGEPLADGCARSDGEASAASLWQDPGRGQTQGGLRAPALPVGSPRWSRLWSGLASLGRCAGPAPGTSLLVRAEAHLGPRGLVGPCSTSPFFH
jgi:hypothetical protein